MATDFETAHTAEMRHDARVKQWVEELVMADTGVA
jgi:hypothetical protein